MTPRERAEATATEIADNNFSGMKFAEICDVIEAAITEHVRALLADDSDMVQMMVDVWRKPRQHVGHGYSDDVAGMCEVFAALRRKAGAE